MEAGMMIQVVKDRTELGLNSSQEEETCELDLER